MTDLPAGPEMDRLIAEKVMGWTLNEDGNWIDGEGEYRYPSPESFAGLSAFGPSTNIAHAWQVVERMREIIRPSIEYVDGLGWRADFETSYGWGETAPLAICRAAIAAMGAR